MVWWKICLCYFSFSAHNSGDVEPLGTGKVRKYSGTIHYEIKMDAFYILIPSRRLIIEKKIILNNIMK